ncbi:MAG: S-layer homology domain-containing protein [Candidatus Gracilibacteria bacterium]|jgi:hypothetical protein
MFGKISSLLAFSFVFFLFQIHSVAASDLPFSDVSTDHWAYEDIKDIYELGIVSGKSANSYDPDSTVTTAEFIKMVTETAGIDLDKYDASSVQWVSEDDWFYEYVNTAWIIDLFDKTEPDIDYNSSYDGSNSLVRYSNTPISRVNAAIILMNAVNPYECITESDGGSLQDIMDWAEDEDLREKWISINTASFYNIIRGFEEYGYPFKPENTLTRAEAAVIVNRAYETFFKPGAFYEDDSNGEFEKTAGSADPGCQAE